MYQRQILRWTCMQAYIETKKFVSSNTIVEWERTKHKTKKEKRMLTVEVEISEERNNGLMFWGK